MQTADVDLLDIDPLGLVEDEPVWDAPAREAVRRALEHSPSGHPHNQQSHAGDGVGLVADKLKLATRIHLKPGEKLVSSQRIRTRADAEGWDLMTAEVDTPGGRQVRLGIIYPDDSKYWTAGPDSKRASRIAELDAEIDRLENGPDLSDSEADRLDDLQSERDALREFDRGNLNRTAVVDPSAVGRMRSEIESGIERAKTWSKARNKIADGYDAVESDPELSPGERADRLARLEAAWQELGDEDQYFAEGSIPGGPEGDLHYLVGAIDDGEGGWKITLGIKPPSAGNDWYIGNDDDEARFEGSDVKKLLKALQELESGRSTEATQPRQVAPPMSFALFSDSPAVQLMMLARALEADDSFLRSGKMVTVNRGKGGKFAKKGVGAAAALDPERRRIGFNRMAAAAGLREVTTTGQNARANAQRRYRAGEEPRAIAADLRRQADELQGRGERGELLASEIADERPHDLEERRLHAISEAKALRRLADAIENESSPSAGGEGVGEAPTTPKPAARRSAVAKALASGDPNALDGMGREALRREAKARGLEPRRGVSEDELRDMLWDDVNAGSDQDAGGSGPRTISTQDSTPEENAIAIMGGRNVWRLESPEQQAAALKATASRTAKRQRSDSNPAPHTIQSMDSTPEENAIAIMGGRNVWQEMRAGGGGANGGSPQAPGVRSIADQIDAIRANPSGGRAKMNALLEPLSHKELDALAAHYGLQKDIRGTKKQKRDTLTQIKVGFLADGAALDGGGNGNPGQSQASATSPPAPIARARAPRSRGAGPTPETQAEIAAIIAAPARGDREKLRGIFNSLTIPQLKKWAADNGYIYDPTGPKSQQVGRLVEHTIGFQLNSAAILGTDWSMPSGSNSTSAPPGTGGPRSALSNRWNAPSTQTLGTREDRKAAREQAIREDRERADTLGTPRLSDSEMDGRIAAAYSAVSGRNNEMVSLVRLRAELADIPTDEVNAALKRLDRERVIQLSPDPNQNSLPDLAHVAALPVGGTDNHFINARREDVNRLGRRSADPK